QFGGGRGGGSFGGSRGSPAGNGRGTNIVLNGQLQYRSTETETLNVFPGLGGKTTNTSVSAPISLNVVRGRSIQNFTVNLTHSSVQSTNAFSGAEIVAGDAGIKFPTTAANDPLNWGVPNLLFSGFTAVQSLPAILRNDTRLTTSYMWLHRTGQHQLRLGGD